MNRFSSVVCVFEQVREPRAQKLNLAERTTPAVRKAHAWRKACAVYLSSPQMTTTRTLVLSLWPPTHQQCCFSTVFRNTDVQHRGQSRGPDLTLQYDEGAIVWICYHLSVTDISSQTGLKPENHESIRIAMQTSAMKWWELYWTFHHHWVDALHVFLKCSCREWTLFVLYLLTWRLTSSLEMTPYWLLLMTHLLTVVA